MPAPSATTSSGSRSHERRRGRRAPPCSGARAACASSRRPATTSSTSAGREAGVLAAPGGTGSASARQIGAISASNSARVSVRRAASRPGGVELDLGRVGARERALRALGGRRAGPARATCGTLARCRRQPVEQPAPPAASSRSSPPSRVSPLVASTSKMPRVAAAGSRRRTCRRRGRRPRRCPRRSWSRP